MLRVTMVVSDAHRLELCSLQPPLTNNAFSPVAGWVRTRGCSFLTGSLRTTPSRSRLNWACSKPEWTAFKPCSLSFSGSDRRLYASTWFANKVSPPTSGVSKMYKNVIPGVCASYETSECQLTVLLRLAKNESNSLPVAPYRWTMCSSGKPSGLPLVGWMWWRPKYPPKPRASWRGTSAKSWSRKATTLRWATKRASWSFPAAVSLLSWTPVTSEPMLGVSFWILLPSGRRSLKVGSASLPCST